MPIQELAYIYRLNTKIRLTMLCLSGYELYSRWVPLKKLISAAAPIIAHNRDLTIRQRRCQ